MRFNGGFNKNDPAHGGRGAQAGSHTFVASRAASVPAAFDYWGSDVGMLGTPTMNQFPGKYGRSTAVYKNALDESSTMEGLWGG